MEKFVNQLTIDGILNQANQVFGDLFNGAMDMVGKLTETIGSIDIGI